MTTLAVILFIWSVCVICIAVLRHALLKGTR
jgi:hypothetical protein